MYLRRARAVGHSFAAAPTHVSTVVTPPVHAAKFRQRCGGVLEVSRDAVAAEEEQLGRCTEEQRKHYRLYLYSGKAIAAMYLRRIRVAGRSFAAALMRVCRVVTPPATAAWRPLTLTLWLIPLGGLNR
jgi:hypothetical protein